MAPPTAPAALANVSPQAGSAPGATLREPSRWLLRLFGAYVRGYLRRHFHAVRLAGPRPAVPAGVPLVVYLSHPSWWDPLVALHLSRTLFSDRASFAPIDEGMLRRYAFFARLGFFPVAPDSGRGMATLGRAAEEILARPDGALWLTPQGRFVDVRERPLRLRSGLGVVAARTRNCLFVPLALEYPFWDESRPEALARFGPAFLRRAGDERAPADWTAFFAGELERTQDALAEEARTRDPARFERLLGGRVGVGGVYDLWRHARARLRGERFHAAHGARG